MKEVDVLIVGAGLGGVAAALSAGSGNASVLLIEPSTWLGGQLTAQGVCTPDEDGINNQPVVDFCGATQTYKDLKHRIRKWYRENTRLSPKGESQGLLNPGGCWVNYGFAAEPNVSVAVLKQMLDETPNVEVWMEATATAGVLEGSSVVSVTVRRSDGTIEVITPKFVLDATETGELLPLLGLPFHIGAESKVVTLEADAPDEAHPEWLQSITVPIALIHQPKGENHTIAKPPNYDEIKAAQNFTLVDGGITGMFTGGQAFWKYRRVIDASLFADAHYARDIATINVGANDYKGADYPTGNPDDDAAAVAGARAASMAYTYWLQTEAPRDEGGHGYPELMPATNFFGNGDFLAPQPYIRESRRIDALTTIVQQDLDVRSQLGQRARPYLDSCGIGNYAMDVHSGPNGAPEIQSKAKPYQIPLGALIPKDCHNLIASCKNIGSTHLTNGCYRLHPQEWNIGEAAGALVLYCLANGVLPAVVQADDKLLIPFQVALLQRGVPLFWWLDLPFGSPGFESAHLLGVRGIFSGNTNDLNFDPNASLSQAEKSALEERVTVPIQWPVGQITRCQAANLIASTMGWLPG